MVKNAFVIVSLLVRAVTHQTSLASYLIIKGEEKWGLVWSVLSNLDFRQSLPLPAARRVHDTSAGFPTAPKGLGRGNFHLGGLHTPCSRTLFVFFKVCSSFLPKKYCP